MMNWVTLKSETMVTSSRTATRVAVLPRPAKVSEPAQLAAIPVMAAQPKLVTQVPMCTVLRQLPLAAKPVMPVQTHKPETVATRVMQQPSAWVLANQTRLPTATMTAETPVMLTAILKRTNPAIQK